MPNYNVNTKTVPDLTKITAAAITDKTKYSIEVGQEEDANKESKAILISELQTLIGGGGGGGTSIEDTAGTTGLYTEETANRLVGHSANTGTSLIFEMFEGTVTPVSVFQIDGNGALANNGSIYFRTYSTSTFIGINAAPNATAATSVIIGDNAGYLLSTGDQNVFIGSTSGRNNTTGWANICIGSGAGFTNSVGLGNIYIGYQTGNNNTGTKNTALGLQAGYTGDGSNCVFYGAYAGFYSTDSNRLIIDNQKRTNAATELTDSLIVGEFNATASSQTLRFNVGTLTKNGYPILAEDASGDVTVSGEITADDFILSSDKRLKENIKPLEYGIDNLMPVEFNFKGKDAKHYGFIAQDINNDDLIKDTGDYLAVRYNSIIAMLVKEVKELKSKVNGIK
jgi:hypothetical protein